jgi:hypothetical protein
VDTSGRVKNFCRESGKTGMSYVQNSRAGNLLV